MFQSITAETVEACQRWCMDTANAQQLRWFQRHVESWIPPAGSAWDADTRDRLVHDLISDFPKQVQQASNQRVSTAGQVHQWLMVHVLESLGWTNGVEFTHLGSRRQADLRIYGPDHRVCLVEVKSLNARERLTNSLAQDTRGHDTVVGVGFFHDATEFNSDTTEALIRTGALAVYLPKTTWAQLPDSQRLATNVGQQRFYRPIRQFAADMTHFRMAGRLAPFTD
ncbi:MAG: hypothetical protein OWU33_05850 [Firmicutes bacterium]|nr:hypothetical protein [Bacillota bacterium]